MAISKEQFREAIDDFYSKEVLLKLYNKYFLDWIAEGYVGSNLDLFSVSLISENSKKQIFLELLEQGMVMESAFKQIISAFPKEVLEIFEHLAWKGRYPLTNKDLEKFLKREDGYYHQRELKDEYLFFRLEKHGNKDYYLWLHNDIIRMIRRHLKKPKDYFLTAKKEVVTKYTKNSTQEAIDKFALYYEFYKKGNLVLSASNKLLKESKRSMQKYCGLDEYYTGSKDLDYLKAETISLFFFMIKKSNLKKETFLIENYKETILSLLSGDLLKEERYSYTNLYLNYIKGTKGKGENLKRSLETIHKLLEELPEGKVGLDNIINYLIFRDEFVDIIDVKDIYNGSYINEANYGRTKVTDYESYKNYVIEPFVKSILFILGTLGILELDYDLPESSNGLYLKNGYLSRYNGLKYISLTDLGKYILGKTDDYDFGVTTEKAEIILDEDRLILTVVGDAPIKKMLLETIGKKITLNKFKFTKEVFLEGIESYEEFEKRIEELKKIIDKPLPHLWENFVEDMRDKVKGIEEVLDIVVYKLDVKNKELLGVLTKNEELKKLILKGENYHLLIKREDVGKVKEILKINGFFI